MNEELIKLCHLCFVDAAKAMTRTLMVTPTELEDFHRAAYNKGVSDSYDAADSAYANEEVLLSILGLRIKP